MNRVTTTRASLFSIVAFILLATNLRPALTTVGPLVGEIQAATGLSGTAVGLLNSLPLLAFSAFAPLAHFARKLGIERTVMAAMLLVFAGIVVRSTGSISLLFVGTLIAGAGIAVGNVLAPSIIKRDYPDRIKGLTTIYAVVLTLSAAIASGLAVPSAEWLASGWQGALAIWAVPALIAAVAWAPAAIRRANPDADSAQTTTATQVWRSPLAWFITAFMGLQSLGFYVAVSWFPTIFQDNGSDPAEAGLLITAFQLVALITSTLLPLLIGRRGEQSTIAAVASLGAAVGLAGLMLLPEWTYLWVVFLGTGSGACFPLALAFISLRTTNHHDAASLSLMAQSIGYLLAAFGPILVGLAHDISGSWTLPLGGLIILALAQGAVGFQAGRNRTV